MSPEEELEELLHKFLRNKISASKFSENFENTYNFKLCDQSVHRGGILEKIFDIVTWYSPYAAQEENPSYNSDEEVYEKVKTLVSMKSSE